MTTSCYLPVFYCFGCCSHQNNRCSQFVLLKFSQLFRSSLQNAPHFVGVAYPPNKILKTVLKMQAFYVCFIKFCLSLNNYKFSGLFYCSIINVLRVAFLMSCNFLSLSHWLLFVNTFLNVFSTFNGEGGIWTLAPLLTTYSLSRGAPSASWVLLQVCRI